MRRLAVLAAAFAGLLFGCRGERSATILYITDAHEIAPVSDRWGERGGVARLKGAVGRLRQRTPDSLLVFGGDLAGGTLFGGVFHGEPMVEALGKAGVGLATFGQHEFDFGAAQTRRLVARSTFPWFTSNLVEPSGAPFAGLPTRIVRRVGALRVGFIGLTDEMATTSQEGLVVERDLVSCAKREAEALEREGVDAIVALTQTGAGQNERLLREVPLLDAILTEEEARERTVVRFVGGRPSAAPLADVGSIVELRLVKPRGRRVRAEVLAHPVDASVTPDPELAAFERREMDELARRLSAPVARLGAAVPASADDPGSPESPLGSLVADAFREAAGAAGASAALVHPGNVRADLPAGPITRREVVAVLPFGNRVTLLELSGATLRGVLERSLARPLQVSGVSYVYDDGTPPRLARVSIGEEPLRDDGLYRVAVSSYLASGGEGLAVLARARRVPMPGGDPLDADALAAYLSRVAGRGGVSAPAPGRITLRRDSPAIVRAP